MPEHLAVLGAVRLGNHVRDLHFDHQHGREDAHIHLLADADRNRPAVLDTGLLEGVFAERLNDKGEIRILAHGLDLLLILVDRDDLLTGLGQSPDQRGTEAAQADHTERCREILLFHSGYLILS